MSVRSEDVFAISLYSRVSPSSILGSDLLRIGVGSLNRILVNTVIPRGVIAVRMVGVSSSLKIPSSIN